MSAARSSSARACSASSRSRRRSSRCDAPAVVVAAGALLAGGANMIFNALWETALQQHVPAAALSRVSAYDWFGSLAFQPLGLVLAGPAAAAFGTSTTLWIATGRHRSRWRCSSVATPSVRQLEKAEMRRHRRILAPWSHDALRRRAREALAAGAERAPARAHFRAMGIDPARLDGPIVGVVSTWTRDDAVQPEPARARRPRQSRASQPPAASRSASTRSPSPTTSRRRHRGCARRSSRAR